MKRVAWIIIAFLGLTTGAILGSRFPLLDPTGPLIPHVLAVLDMVLAGCMVVTIRNITFRVFDPLELNRAFLPLALFRGLRLGAALFLAVQALRFFWLAVLLIWWG